MTLNSLNAISPIDGRYRVKLKKLSLYFSEMALIKYRIKIETLYLIELSKIKVIRSLRHKEKQYLNSLSDKLTLTDANKIKKIEKTIRHDLKAVEYFIKNKLAKTSMADIGEYVHFALTSWDINNLASSLMISDCVQKIYLPELKQTIKQIKQLAKKYSHIIMLARTHGQVASPTSLGKELAVFSHRLKNQQDTIPQLTGKLNGAVGNYNAHSLAYPNINWIRFSKNFVKKLKLKPNLITTQIDNYDSWAQLFQTMVRINNILLDLNQDMWAYISLDYLKQKTVKKEVGSSTMPHKINPIDFENSEGNLGMANSILNHLASKLPISRMQRDLSDSTVSRNVGLAFAYSMLALKGTKKGLTKITANKKVISQDLHKHPEVIAEGIQAILRTKNTKMPYEKLKDLTRGKKITMKQFHQFIDELKIPNSVKKELKKIKPENYYGLAPKLIKVAGGS